MKVIHLFFTALCAASVWTKSIPAMVMFAKVKDKWIPLSKKKDRSIFWLSEDPSAVPAKFVLEDGYIKTLDPYNPQYVVFIQRALAIGPDYLKMKFEYDEGKIVHQPFYKCEINNQDFILSYGRDENCIAVDIYVLLEGDYTRSLMTNTQDSHENRKNGDGSHFYKDVAKTEPINP